jgi:putative heme iron utilization protein
MDKKMTDQRKLAQWEIDEIVSHMNEDHSDSLLLYARHYGGCLNATSALLLDIKEDTCSLAVESQNKEEMVVVKLKRSVANIKQAELVMVEMHFDALRAQNESVLADEKEPI